MTSTIFWLEPAFTLGLRWPSSYLHTKFFYHHIAQEFNFSLNKVEFHSLVVNILSNLFVNTSLYLTNTLWMCFGGGVSFLASPWVPLSCYSQFMTINCSFYIWSIGTKFNLVLPTIGVFVNFKFISLPSLHTINTLACNLHVRVSTKMSSKEMHLIHSHVVESPHYKVKYNAAYFVSCGLSFMKRTLLGFARSMGWQTPTH